jgi:hypothetical protein
MADIEAHIAIVSASADKLCGNATWLTGVAGLGRDRLGVRRRLGIASPSPTSPGLRDSMLTACEGILRRSSRPS